MKHEHRYHGPRGCPQGIFRSDKPDTAIISITDTNSPQNKFDHPPWLKAVLRLQFDDVLADSFWGLCIKDEDALKIKQFVDQVKTKVDRIIVHCEAGVSRSAGLPPPS